MTTPEREPVRYGRHAHLYPGEVCELCSERQVVLVADHCHAHGWVRGTLCSSCNARMGWIDRKIAPRRMSLADAITYAARCPDCTAIIEDEFISPGGRGPHVNVRMRRDTHQRIDQLAIQLSPVVGRRLSWADMLDALVTTAHVDELADVLKDD